jgi:hypothetical protein
MKCHQFSQGFVPKIYSTDDINTKRGADFGAFRPVIQGVEGGYNMDYDQERRCKLVIPFQVLFLNYLFE